MSFALLQTATNYASTSNRYVDRIVTYLLLNFVWRYVLVNLVFGD